MHTLAQAQTSELMLLDHLQYAAADRHLWLSTASYTTHLFCASIYSLYIMATIKSIIFIPVTNASPGCIYYACESMHVWPESPPLPPHPLHPPHRPHRFHHHLVFHADVLKLLVADGVFTSGDKLKWETGSTGSTLPVFLLSLSLLLTEGAIEPASLTQMWCTLLRSNSQTLSNVKHFFFPRLANFEASGDIYLLTWVWKHKHADHRPKKHIIYYSRGRQKDCSSDAVATVRPGVFTAHC